MEIEVAAAGFLKRYVPDIAKLPADKWAGQNIAQLISGLGIPDHISVVVLVNDERKPKDYLLQPGDIVKLIPLATGG